MSQLRHDDLGLRERKRRATHERIAAEAARLVAERGVAGTSIEAIAEAAGISRATFFRYYDAKETAVSEGFSLPWVELLLEVLRGQPTHLSPMEAITAAFVEISTGFDEAASALALQQLQIARTSRSLQAWMLDSYVRNEQLIAEVIAPRFTSRSAGDPRPRLAGAAAMAAVRIGLDEWVESEGRQDLPGLLRRGLASVEIR